MKEWYLISNTSPSVLGGFEDTYHADSKEIAFAESLDTDIAKSVILYNYDLSESTEIRCIIQGNSADTQLKSMERIGLFVRGTVKAGMYIFFENRYWLITGYPSYNGIYEKAVMQLCQYQLRWQNASGEIIERWICTSSAAKYDTGEKSNSTIVLSTDNLTLLLPNDDESLDLDGKRVFIDKRKVNPTKVYKITRTDSVLYDFGDEHGGILSFIADKTELNTTTDRQDLRLCDYIEIDDDTDSEDDSTDPTTPPENPNKTTDLSAAINGSETLRCGYQRSYSVSFTDVDGNAVENVNFSWKVTSKFEVNQSIDDNKIKLLVEDDSLIGESFILSVISNETILAEMEIVVVGIM